MSTFIAGITNDNRMLKNHNIRRQRNFIKGVGKNREIKYT